jgi:hypothetical protein
VLAVALDQIAHGWSPDVMLFAVTKKQIASTLLGGVIVGDGVSEIDAEKRAGLRRPYLVRIGVA